MSSEKLHAMIDKNQEERFALMERRALIAEGDEEDHMGDDPEMIKLKLSGFHSLEYSG